MPRGARRVHRVECTRLRVHARYDAGTGVLSVLGWSRHGGPQHRESHSEPSWRRDSRVAVRRHRPVQSARHRRLCCRLHPADAVAGDARCERAADPRPRICHSAALDPRVRGDDCRSRPVVPCRLLLPVCCLPASSARERRVRHLMDAVALLADGISRATSPELLIATLIGVVVGLIVGVLPGIGPAAGTAIMLPVAVGFGGTAAIAGRAGIYYGAMFGGAVTSILLGIPGDAPSVMTVI